MDWAYDMDAGNCTLCTLLREICLLAGALTVILKTECLILFATLLFIVLQLSEMLNEQEERKCLLLA